MKQSSDAKNSTATGETLGTSASTARLGMCVAVLVEVPSTIKYRQPFGWAEKQEIEWPFTREREGKRSPLDTGQVASAGVVALHAR